MKCVYNEYGNNQQDKLGRQFGRSKVDSFHWYRELDKKLPDCRHVQLDIADLYDVIDIDVYVKTSV